MAKRMKHKRLTPEEEEQIEQMFFGPYKKEWYNKDGVVDNSDKTIAKRLGLHHNTVCNYIYRILNIKWDQLNKDR